MTYSIFSKLKRKFKMADLLSSEELTDIFVEQIKLLNYISVDSTGCDSNTEEHFIRVKVGNRYLTSVIVDCREKESIVDKGYIKTQLKVFTKEEAIEFFNGKILPELTAAYFNYLIPTITDALVEILRKADIRKLDWSVETKYQGAMEVGRRLNVLGRIFDFSHYGYRAGFIPVFMYHFNDQPSTFTSDKFDENFDALVERAKSDLYEVIKDLL